MVKELKLLEKHGWVYYQTHPILPLSIWNYSNKTQYEGYWTDITLATRGLVLNNDTGEVVSRGFPKFFNYSEGKTNLPENIRKVTIYEKLDGSYIGLFYFNGQWVVNSRGSFDSDQSKMAEELLKNKDLNKLDKNLTYCFELIHPENRICVDYGDRKELVFLAAFNKKGEEFEYHKNMLNLKFSVVERQKMSTFVYEELKEQSIPNKEGYVVKFSNGERCKIKFDEYIKLHSLYTRTSTRDIWKCLKNGDDIETILEDCPDEIYDWIKDVKEGLEKEFRILFLTILSRYHRFVLSLWECEDKTFALAVKDDEYKSFLFALRNGKDITEKIWKLIKPEHKIFTDEHKDN